VNRLISGLDDVDSAQLARRQWELGRVVADDPDLTARFDAGAAGIDVSGSALDEPLKRFLADWGHRCNDEYELASPTWSMAPAPVLAAVDRLRHAPADRSPAAITASLAADRELAEEELARTVPRPMRRFARRAVAAARAGSIGRERAKDILVKENLGVRMALHELWRRAAARGGPSDFKACACIAYDELADFVRDPRPFLAVIEERAEFRDYLAAREPPFWFDGHLSLPDTWPMRQRPSHVHQQGAVLEGIAVSSGQASGPARVITDPSDPRGLEPGEVLVCPITDPSWTPLFLVAGAVVSDTGAMLSHSAIVARELGIPGVMSVESATSIVDGTWLDVDGDRGTVTVGAPPGG
jgi:phosphohistidine swiveling domain-containing protein